MALLMVMTVCLLVYAALEPATGLLLATDGLSRHGYGWRRGQRAA